MRYTPSPPPVRTLYFLKAVGASRFLSLRTRLLSYIAYQPTSPALINLVISVLDLIHFPRLNPCQVLKALPRLRQRFREIAQDLFDPKPVLDRDTIDPNPDFVLIRLDGKGDYEDLPDLVEVPQARL